jgi:drug/metabolite transporter (DMT)-like permease
VSKGILNWMIFIALSVIWGSSFILMKEGLMHLTAYQVAAIRILSSGIVLLPFAFSAFKNTSYQVMGCFLKWCIG